MTSKTGAAWQDVQNVIGRRWPMVKLLLAPVNVQGIEAEKSITEGIRRLDRDPRPDLILVTRGGGSKEDLWVFNSERIARVAAACRKPVVSAVGHEIDTSILDYVADLRAPTPSAAAEMCVPDQADVRQKIFILQQNIQKIYRIVAIYAIIGLISWPLPRFYSADTASLPTGSGSWPRCRRLCKAPHSDACRVLNGSCKTPPLWRNP